MGKISLMRNFQGYFSKLSRTKVIFQDFPKGVGTLGLYHDSHNVYRDRHSNENVKK